MIEGIRKQLDDVEAQMVSHVLPHYADGRELTFD